ncbi:UNVERIFIED_CONTAM: hypothetical protein FKN15_060077 [Acipenser sinensis]
MYVEALVAHKRDILTKTKQARDGLRMDNLKLRQRCRLLGNDDLLRDFEDKVDTSEARNVDAEMQWCKEKNRASMRLLKTVTHTCDVQKSIKDPVVALTDSLRAGTDRRLSPLLEVGQSLEY